MQFNWKKAFWILVVLVFVYILVVIIRLLLSARNKGSELKPLSLVQPTITENQAKNLAERLYLAMDRFGTNEIEVQNVFDSLHNNAANLSLVNNAFGNRIYSFSAGISGWGLIHNAVPLYSWLENELSKKEFEPWAKLYNELG